MGFLVSLWPLVRKYWREAVIVGLSLGLMVACVKRDHGLEAKGAAQERNRVADSTLKVVIPPLWKTDTVIVKDTVRLRVTLARLDTLRDTVLQHLTDTVLVKEYVTRADSAAQACTELAHDCEAFRAYATQTIAALQSKVNTAPQIVVKSCVGHDVTFAVLGTAVGFLAGRR